MNEDTLAGVAVGLVAGIAGTFGVMKWLRYRDEVTAFTAYAGGDAELGALMRKASHGDTKAAAEITRRSEENFAKILREATA